MVRAPPDPETDGMESHDQDPTTPQGSDSPADAADPSERATERSADTGDPSARPTERSADADDPSERPTEPSAGAAGTPAGDPPQGAAPYAPRTGGAIPDGGAAEGPRRLYRSRDQRVIGGVCGGLAEYFGIDPLIVRIITVGLVFAGGAGFLAYLAAWLLVPEEDGDALSDGNGRLATIAGSVLLVLAIGTVLPFWHGPFGGWGWGGPFLSLICLGLAGLGVWWVASGERPGASGARDILRRAGFGIALLAVCGLLALGGAWATAAGGGVVVAVVVIVAGLWLVAGAFLGGARWLILPALALALPAGVVSAANLDVQGGVGDREYRPAAASELQRTYRLGVGHLMLDLRNTELPPGDQRLHVEIGVGAVSIAVPRNVCVTSTAHAGAGQVNVFDHGSGGLDVNWRDDRRAPAGATRLVVDADVGVGALDVTYDDPRTDHFDRRRSVADRERGNAACIGGVRG
jgi:phage shock protein PspC (stress-responsive transcriptional regulator)